MLSGLSAVMPVQPTLKIPDKCSRLNKTRFAVLGVTIVIVSWMDTRI